MPKLSLHAVLRGVTSARQAFVVALLTIASIAAARPEEQRTVAQEDSKLIQPVSIQGCYDLGKLNWRPDLKLGEDEVFITPPTRIELLDAHKSFGLEKNGYSVRPAPGFSPSIHRFAYWMPTSPNAIEIVFSTGTSGLTMKLKWDGRALHGKAKTHWDFLRRGQTAKIVAPRVECASTH